jgi:hypothetical protein
MADVGIEIGKQGFPRIVLALTEKDRDHIIKFAKFLACTIA